VAPVADIATVLLCARLSKAAYVTDDAARAAALPPGVVERGYVIGREDARALVCEVPRIGVAYAFQGTQFTKGELASIWENFRIHRVDVGNGRGVMAGYDAQLQALRSGLNDAPAPDLVTGHSMGGDIAELFLNIDSHAFCVPVPLLVTFGAPKCADASFWRAATVMPRRIVHARDFAPCWPFVSDFLQPGTEGWLHDGVLEEVASRPVAADSVDDHEIDAYIAALEALH
jgi:hypothetical protein